MDGTAMLTSMALFALLAGLCSIIFNRLKLPPLIGYLVAGIVVANVFHVNETGEIVISMLSDMGLVLLMFCIGLEINLKKIRKQGMFAIEVAVIQLPLMVLGGFIAGNFLGFNMIQCLTLGAIISGSSTAVVMAVLKSQNKLDREHIETLVLITIMEDIGQVIILSIITPVLAGSSMNPTDLVVMVVSIVVFMVASMHIGFRFIPRLINWVSDNVTEEILMILSVGMAFGLALLSTYAGLSMAIGAFLMGMIMSACRKSKEINESIDPMKNLFMAMFFISVGMEISVNTLVDNIGMIVAIYLVFAILKSSTVFLGYWVGNQDGRTGFLSAVGLVAMGEFAFIIAKEALDFGVVNESFYTSVIGAALLSMIMLPFLTRYSDRIWDKSVEKCPDWLNRRILKVNAARDSLYMNIYATSKKSRKAIRKSMTRAYINVLVLAILEIAFYIVVPKLGRFLSDAFGGDVFLWYLGLLVVNFVVLLIPATYIVKNVKFLDEIVIAGAQRISRLDGREDEFGHLYQKFLDMNTSFMAMIIVFVIILLVPNPLPLSAHLLILVLAAIVVYVIYRYLDRKGKEKKNLPE
ncbi:MAG: cation:proton antiporter [Candidatus Methanomethylophilaceae archaeon]|nr:cation:proton antiporter [Candidatus Methanomethylophilaceae archaeon]